MAKSLIIPVENQVRELDAKLLLSLIAAERGYTSFIGARRLIDFRIASFPRSIYLSKSMTRRSRKMFRIMSDLGHRIVAWDEEALIHPPDDIYFSRRLDPISIKYVTDLFAWGEENAQLWQRYPDLPPFIRIHLTGNPRGDLLRHEMTGFFDKETRKLKEKYGDFLLINTNFSFVNPFYPEQGLFKQGKSTKKGTPQVGLAGTGMDPSFVERLYRHKTNIFKSFIEMIPWVASNFPDNTVVVRPHPVENPGCYHDMAGNFANVVVTNHGNVIPWILASQAVIHNGCTTGIEAYMLKAVAISYQAARDSILDEEFYKLPNFLSHSCSSLEELKATISSVIAGETGPAAGEDRDRLMSRYLAYQHGPLACELILDIIDDIYDDFADSPAPPRGRQLKGASKALFRRFKKYLKSFKPQSKHRPEFQRYRFPGISVNEVKERLDRLGTVSCHRLSPEVQEISDSIFKISSEA